MPQSFRSVRTRTRTQVIFLYLEGRSTRVFTDLSALYAFVIDLLDCVVMVGAWVFVACGPVLVPEAHPAGGQPLHSTLVLVGTWHVFAGVDKIVWPLLCSEILEALRSLD